MSTTKKKGKNEKSASSHPPVKEMVNAAIVSLKERTGSSLQAIKKYIAANFQVDMQKLSPHLNKYLTKAVTDGTLIRTKGKGASGSFKINTAQTEIPKSKKLTQSKSEVAKTTTVLPREIVNSKTKRSKASAVSVKKDIKKKPNSPLKKTKKQSVKPKKTPKRKKAKSVRIWLTKEQAKSVPRKDWYRVFVLKQKL